MDGTASLPTGTVTFLFTDIEGYTRLWEQHPEAMRLAVARHDVLLRHAIQQHGGQTFKTGGDAFCVAFASPAGPPAGQRGEGSERSGLFFVARRRRNPLSRASVRVTGGAAAGCSGVFRGPPAS
jgi:class 3 adenylate cyclase